MLKNLTDEPEMTTEAKAQCRLAALHQLDNVRSDIRALVDLFGHEAVSWPGHEATTTLSCSAIFKPH